MKRIIFTLCLFFFLTMFANASELYRCKDSHGNTVITDSPKTGMKNCKYFETESSSEEPPKKADEKKDNESSAKDTKNISEERAKRINRCIHCCNDKIDTCYNYTADSRLCMAENRNCAATCKSEGSSPSSWSDCWSQSNK